MTDRLQIGYLELDGSVLCMACGDDWKTTPLYSAPYRQEQCARCHRHMGAVAKAMRSSDQERASAIKHGDWREQTAADMRDEAAHERDVHFSRRRHPDWTV